MAKSFVSMKAADPKSVVRESEYVRRPKVAKSLGRAITKTTQSMRGGKR